MKLPNLQIVRLLVWRGPEEKHYRFLEFFHLKTKISFIEKVKQSGETALHKDLLRWKVWGHNWNKINKAGTVTSGLLMFK